jgi:hypothetical protein
MAEGTSNSILDDLDRLCEIGSDVALEFGWLANAYFDAEKPNLIAEFGTESAALHETISFIHEREASFITARSTVADRMRVTRYMTKEWYDDMYQETGFRPSFHQLRACLITANGEVDKKATDEMVLWCTSNEWPTVQAIREYRDGIDPEPIIDKHWRRLVKLAEIVSRDTQLIKNEGRYYACNAVFKEDESERAPKAQAGETRLPETSSHLIVGGTRGDYA